jgi:coproporphyrinogen III oxidase-like Fe-S oxidoreductase
VSNWARDDDARCRYNLLYWRGADWWGLGPGAHSHVGGTRWWNVKHPAAYSAALARNGWPAAGREILTPGEADTEEIMLRLRLVEGLPLARLGPAGVEAARTLVTDGLLRADAYAAGTAALTLHGRLLADAAVRTLLLA